MLDKSKLFALGILVLFVFSMIAVSAQATNVVVSGEPFFVISSVQAAGGSFSGKGQFSTNPTINSLFPVYITAVVTNKGANGTRNVEATLQEKRLINSWGNIPKPLAIVSGVSNCVPYESHTATSKVFLAAGTSTTLNFVIVPKRLIGTRSPSEDFGVLVQSFKQCASLGDSGIMSAQAIPVHVEAHTSFGDIISPDPTCSDGARNGDETDIDCGTSCNKVCGPLNLCHVGTDCAAGLMCSATSNVPGFGKCVEDKSVIDKNNGEQSQVLEHTCENGQYVDSQGNCIDASSSNGGSSNTNLKGVRCGVNQVTDSTGKCVDRSSGELLPGAGSSSIFGIIFVLIGIIGLVYYFGFRKKR